MKNHEVVAKIRAIKADAESAALHADEGTTDGIHKKHLILTRKELMDIIHKAEALREEVKSLYIDDVEDGPFIKPEPAILPTEPTPPTDEVVTE